jgi:hypothetical protein
VVAHHHANTKARVSNGRSHLRCYGRGPSLRTREPGRPSTRGSYDESSCGTAQASLRCPDNHAIGLAPRCSLPPTCARSRAKPVDQGAARHQHVKKRTARSHLCAGKWATGTAGKSAGSPQDIRKQLLIANLNQRCWCSSSSLIRNLLTRGQNSKRQDRRSFNPQVLGSSPSGGTNQTPR